MKFNNFKKLAVFMTLSIMSACANNPNTVDSQFASLDAQNQVNAQSLFHHPDMSYPKVHPQYYHRKYPVIVMAHRGYSDVAPENTMSAFKKAYQIGADMVELDVHLSKDGQLIVMHDDTLDRTTNGKGKIGDKTLAELKTLDAGSHFSPAFKGEQIPTLDEVLIYAKDKICVNIEIKAEAVEDNPKPGMGIEQKVVQAVKKYGMEQHVIVSSFSSKALATVKGFDRQIPTGMLIVTDGLFNQQLDSVGEVMADSVHEYNKFVSKSEIEKAHKVGIDENPWTEDDPHKMLELINRGVDGLITDRPDLALRVLAEKFPLLK